jgi:hypothetical protein
VVLPSSSPVPVRVCPWLVPFDRASDCVLNRDRDGLRVGAAISVRKLHVDIIDIVAARIGRQFEVRRGDER